MSQVWKSSHIFHLPLIQRECLDGCARRGSQLGMRVISAKNLSNQIGNPAAWIENAFFKQYHYEFWKVLSGGV